MTKLGAFIMWPIRQLTSYLAWRRKSRALRQREPYLYK